MSHKSDDLFVPYGDLGPKHGIYFTRVHLRRLIEKRLFPGAFQLSPNRIGWRLSDIEEWKLTRPPRRAA
jgi:hypothetical protein